MVEDMALFSFAHVILLHILNFPRCPISSLSFIFVVVNSSVLNQVHLTLCLISLDYIHIPAKHRLRLLCYSKSEEMTVLT